MAQPRIKIISDGISEDTQVLYGDGDNWIDLAGVVSEITWHLTAWGDPASATLHVVIPRLEAAAEDVKLVIQRMQDERAAPEIPSLLEEQPRDKVGY